MADVGSRAPRRIGYTIIGRSWMYTDVIPRSRRHLTPRHSVLNQWDLLAPWGFRPRSRTRSGADARRRARDRYVVERSWPRRSRPREAWSSFTSAPARASSGGPKSRSSSLVVALIRQDESRRVFLTSGPSDADAARRIADAARERLGPAGDGCSRGAPLNLTDLRALIARARVFIGGDSGPLHIAATTRVPIVELLGPTLAERSFPWRDPRWFTEIVDPGALPCRPCRSANVRSRATSDA